MNNHDEAEVIIIPRLIPVKLPDGPWNKDKKKAHALAYRAANREYFIAKAKLRRLANPERSRKEMALWRAINKERFAAMKKAWRNANPEKVAAQKKRHRIKHADSIRLKNRRYQQENREKVRAWMKKHRDANPQHVRDLGRIHRANRRARMTGGKISRDLPQRLLREQKHVCAYCPTDLHESGYHLEHRIPLVRGGKHEDANMQLTCPVCNLRKFTMTDEEFRAYLVPTAPTSPS